MTELRWRTGWSLGLKTMRRSSLPPERAAELSDRWHVTHGRGRPSRVAGRPARTGGPGPGRRPSRRPGR
jgi:hypothetical protein